MREVSEDEVVAMAGESECPVLAKEESEEMEAAVCLKAFPQGYVLGISDKVQDLHLWFTPELAVAEREDERYISTCARAALRTVNNHNAESNVALQVTCETHATPG